CGARAGASRGPLAPWRKREPREARWTSSKRCSRRSAVFRARRDIPRVHRSQPASWAARSRASSRAEYLSSRTRAPNTLLFLRPEAHRAPDLVERDLAHALDAFAQQVAPENVAVEVRVELPPLGYATPCDAILPRSVDRGGGARVHLCQGLRE